MWTWLKDGVFWIVNWMYEFCGDWGMAIIIITVIFRLLIFPLTQKQTKSTYEMQRLQPKIQEIQTRYADDKNRQSQETMKIYSDNKINPLAGCLPMLLQMPIFIILFQVLREYIPEGANFYGIIPDLTVMPNAFLSNGEPIVNAIPYIILVLIFGLSMLIPMFMQKNAQSSAKWMSIIMSGFMLWVGSTSPAGVLLYWDVSSIFGICQQAIVQKILKNKYEKKDAENTVVEPVKVDIERKLKKPKPTKRK